ncbi:SDR family NAD(P)-dependent oxidoreductase, partial [Lacticaseibacillus rhamnosus]
RRHILAAEERRDVTQARRLQELARWVEQSSTQRPLPLPRASLEESPAEAAARVRTWLGLEISDRGISMIEAFAKDFGLDFFPTLFEVLDFRQMNEVAAYGASKAAVGSLTKSLAVEWSKHGVMVNAIVPGVFRTELNAQLLDDTARGREVLQGDHLPCEVGEAERSNLCSLG